MEEEPKRNRVYIASKVNNNEANVQELRDELVRRGYEIVYDWTANPVPKPFEEHAEEAGRAALAMVEAVRVCDHFILLCAPNGLGMYIEMGGTLVTSIILNLITHQHQKRIFVVGEGNDRSVFYFAPSVERLPDMSALLEHFPPLA